MTRSRRSPSGLAVTSAVLSTLMILASCSAPIAPDPTVASEQPETVASPAPPSEDEVTVEGKNGAVVAASEDIAEGAGGAPADGEELVEDDEGALIEDEELIESDTGALVDSEAPIEDDDGDLITPGDSPSTPLLVKLTMSRPPAVGDEAGIVVEVMMNLDDAPAVTARVDLPPGVKLVSGATTWEGSLKAGESIRFAATVVFAEPGEYRVSATALAPINPDMIYGDDDAVFLTVGEDASHFGLESGDNAQVESSSGP
jgi:hypothetical protein